MKPAYQDVSAIKPFLLGAKTNIEDLTGLTVFEGFSLPFFRIRHSIQFEKQALQGYDTERSQVDHLETTWGPLEEIIQGMSGASSGVCLGIVWGMS